jgi:hypothetical protein
MKRSAAQKLHLAGYRVRYGSDGYDHLIPIHLFKRGAKALCGHTASKWDYDETKPVCPKCAKQILTKRDGKPYIIPSCMLGEV